MRTATLFNYLVEAELIGSAVMVGVMLVRVFLRKPLGSRFVRALWLLVALRLLLPIALPNPVMNALKPTLSLDAGIRPMADQVRTRVGDAATVLYWKAVGGSSPTLREALSRLARAAGNGRLSWLLMLVYLLGAVCTAGGIVIWNIRFGRRMKGQPVSEGIQKQWERICAEMGVRKAPRLAAAEGLASACAVGCFRPCVAVPAGVPEEALEASLRHACAHVRLHTGFWGLVRGLCLCAHWFNPLVWVCAFLSRADDLLACDELAVASMPREHYAGWLIHQKDTRLAVPAPWVAASCVSVSAPTLRQRIRLTLHPGTVRPAALGAVCLAAALTLSVMFATDEQSSVEYIPMLTSPSVLDAGDDLTTSQGAEAFARRFMMLEGIAADRPSEYATVIQTVDGWRVSLYMPSGATCELAFDQQGNLLYYADFTVNDAALRPLAEPITADTAEGRAWCEFLAAFLERHLPATYDAFEAMEIAGSGRRDGEEYLTVRLLDGEGRPFCEVAIQVAPEGRIFSIIPGEIAQES